MSDAFAGKVVLIAGGARNLGRASACVAHDKR
jgi:NAD(P)-dependent dehydrogenase (short-subunit alcohol dehydrogenase family)